LTKGESQLLLIIEAKSANYWSFNIGWSAKADLERAIAEQKELLQERRVPNSPTSQVLEVGPGLPVLVMPMTGPDYQGWSGPVSPGPRPVFIKDRMRV